MLLGSRGGRGLAMKMSRDLFVRRVTWRALVSGLALILRYFCG
jgi:hypothetical protein